MIKIKNLYASYGKKEVLHNVSLDIEEKEIVTLVGSNGSGKSTLLKSIYNIIDNKKGNIFFENRDISNVETKKLLEKHIVYIGQKNNVFESFTVYQNLQVASFYNNRNKNIENILKEFPTLLKIQNKKARNLSGGQKQLLALSMGLLNEPKLILFDEPSAGLDVKTLKLVFEKIKKLNENKNITFLIVEHRINEISKITDRFIALKLGKVFKSTKNKDELNDVFI